MKKLLALAVVSLSFLPRLYSADARAELQDLVQKVETKLQAGNPTEEDLAPEFKTFDTLLTEHKGEKTEDVAEILFAKGMLYAQINDYSKATATLQEVKTDFPQSENAAKADTVIASIKREENAKKIQDSLTVGTQFPDFSEEDLNGKPLSVAGDKGKIVLVDFWATWCGPCVQELPNVIKIYAQNHDKGFDVIGISLDSDKDKLTGFIKEKDMTWPQYFDGKAWENALALKYGIQVIPATFLLGRDGKIIGRDLRGEDLDHAVAAALAAAPAASSPR